MEEPWRVDDVVAYDIMREKATVLTSEILRTTPDLEKRLERIRALREKVDAVNSRDRLQIDQMTDELAAQIRAMKSVS